MNPLTISKQLEEDDAFREAILDEANAISDALNRWGNEEDSLIAARALVKLYTMMPKDTFGQSATPDPKCPECGKPASEHPRLSPDTLDGKQCDMVYGRRGWRQLGVYDG